MKKSIRHILMVTAGVFAVSSVYADDDIAPLDGFSSIVLEIGRNATSANNDITEFNAANASDDDSACNFLSPKALEARVAGVGMFLDNVQDQLPAIDGKKLVDEFVTRDQNMSQQISSIEYKFAAQLQQQIAVLDAENADLRARLSELQATQTFVKDNSTKDTEAMQAIENAEQALAAARAAIGGK